MTGTEHDGNPEDDGQSGLAEDRGSLRGTFVAVILMAAFFVATWFGMLAIALERR